MNKSIQFSLFPVKSIILFFVWVVVLSACDSEGGGSTASGPEPGFGSSNERPVGKPFNLPAGITLKNNRVDTPDYCYSTEELIEILLGETREKILGTPGFFTVCMTFTNTNPVGTAPVTITCPAGLVFIAQRDKDGRLKQNGITVSDVEIRIAAGMTQSVLLDMYCLNGDRSRPALETSFEIGPVTENAGMRNLINQLKNKNIHNDQVGTNWQSIVTTIQNAVYFVADGEEIPSTIQKELDKL